MTSQTAPAIIHKLVETFEQNLESYRSSKNETELRRQFLDPFFTALGWDVANEKGYDEAGKEVTHEFSVDVAGQQKKADYAFRVGRGEKFDFLVEAKKPSVKIESNQDSAFQIRRYGWSAKLPINILTDFEHFAIYDCRTKPNYSDKASIGRIKIIHYKEYVERWNEIVEIFSPEAVRKGSFAKYAESMKGKKGTADVDDAFLQEIERWRELLAKNIALRNETIDIAGLNYSVQMTIDRIVFLRICEERGIEPENQLQEIISRDDVYQELCELFKRADTKYNSGLFHFKQEKEQNSRPDDLTLSLDIDDKVLKDIISNLYYPKSPYAFLYIPSDILGQVYERFLGKVIRLTTGHQAKVEEKPEVRKAGGVYYTPTYIVDYIVKSTVGKLVENKSPKDIASLKIVDPSCGSGTFLLGAYQFLLDWHLNWYVENEPEKAEKNKAIVKVGDSYRLTTAKKKEILLNNIHGVDIDAQAVEVTKLSLLLKVLENASGQLGLGMERVLPDLGNNIKCGNSLIGFDYFEGQLFPKNEERIRINPFDWKNEFRDVFAKGGFNAVIGNPPWAFTKYVDWGNDTKNYIQQKYLSGRAKEVQSRAKQAGKINLFAVFMLKGLEILRKEGLFSFIIPNNILRTTVYDIVRRQILETYSIKQVVDLKAGVFEGVTASTVIVTIESTLPNQKTSIEVIDNQPLGEIESIISNKVNQLGCLENPSYVIDIFSDESLKSLVSKIDGISENLGNLVNVLNGIATEKDMAGILNKKQDKNSKPILFGKDIARYSFEYTGKYVDYVREKLLRARDESIFLAPEKLIMQRIGGILITAYDNEQYYTFNSVNNLLLKDGVQYSLKYILGLLNSRLLRFYYISRFTNKSSLTVNISKTFLDQLPIFKIDFSDSKEKARHDKMVSLVEQMIESNKLLVATHTPQGKEGLERQITVTERAIDLLVYQLYGLNEEEIKVVEGSL